PATTKAPERRTCGTLPTTAYEERKMTTNLERACAVVADLQAKLGELAKRKALLEHETAEIGFEVHAEGNDKARKRLDQIVRELVGIEAELTSLTGAVRAAQERVIQAQTAERAEAERQKAKAAVALRKDLLDAAKIADRNFEQ